MIAFALVAAASIVSFTSAQTSIIVNGGFENSTGVGWYCNAGGTCGIDGPGSGHFAYEGSDYAYVFPNSTLMQQTTATAGTAYTLTFAAYVINYSPTSANVQVGWWTGDVTTTLPLPFNSTTNALYVEVAEGDQSTGPYALFTYSLTAAGNDILGFQLDPSAPAATALRIDGITLVAGGAASTSGEIAASAAVSTEMMTTTRVTTAMSVSSATSSETGTPVPGHSSNKGLIAGCSVLGVAAAASLAGLAFIFYRRRQRAMLATPRPTVGGDPEKSAGPSPTAGSFGQPHQPMQYGGAYQQQGYQPQYAQYPSQPQQTTSPRPTSRVPEIMEAHQPNRYPYYQS